MRRLRLIAPFLGAILLFFPQQAAHGYQVLSSQENPAAGQADPSATLTNPADVVVHGAHLPPINMYGTEILAFNDLVGKDLALIHYFYGWYDISWTYLPNQIRQQITPDRRPQIMISWLPVGRNCRTMAPDQLGDWSVNTSLYDIVAGHCDDYIRRMALQLKDMPFTFLMRFGQEMNLLNVSWWVGYYNRDPQLFIDAYQRVHDVFSSTGITNVQWVWSPSYASNPREEWNSLFQYYPGDRYVDWIGLLVFNQGEWLGVPWWSLAELLDSDTWDHVLPEIMCRYAKPIILDLGSVDGSRPGDGTKGDWVREGYAALDQFPFIKGMVWFNDWNFHDPNAADFRVVGGSSHEPDIWHTGYAYPLPSGDGAWTEGYRAAIARQEFVSYLPPLQDITPPTTWCSREPVFNLPTPLHILPGQTREFSISAMGLSEDVQVSVDENVRGIDLTLSATSLLEPWDDIQVRVSVGSDVTFGIYQIPIYFTPVSSPDRQQVYLTLTITDQVYQTYIPLAQR